MLLKGMSVQQVADILEIPVESVEQIKKD
jgi:DNA-directed RNA polymerase specialized sigma24 family protein